MAFDAEVEILTEFTSDPDDPKLTAKACFTAAIVYACFLGFCGCQVRKRLARFYVVMETLNHFFSFFFFCRCWYINSTLVIKFNFKYTTTSAT